PAPGGPSPAPPAVGKAVAGATAPVAPPRAPSTPSHAYLIPALSLLAYVALWFSPVTLQDPWYEALADVNAARGAGDSGAKRALLAKAGAQLDELVRLHPYHARVHFILAYYYNDVGDSDRAMAEAKEAIRLGSGAKVNQVDGLARDVLVDAAV